MIRLSEAAEGNGPRAPTVRNGSATQERADFDVTAAYRDFGRELYHFALNALGDRQAAEEAIQETFIRAWRARGRYSAEQASERTWLYAIARNIIRDAYRRRHREPEPVDESRWENTADHQRDPTEHLMLIEALAQLSFEHRQAVLAIHVMGLNYAELSESLDVPKTTLRSRTFHGLRALRQYIKFAENADE